MATYRTRKIYDRRRHEQWMRWYTPIGVLVGFTIFAFGCQELVRWHLRHCGDDIIQAPEKLVENAQIFGTLGFLTILASPLWSLFDKLENAQHLRGTDGQQQRLWTIIRILIAVAVVVALIMYFGAPSTENTPTGWGYVCALHERWEQLFR